MTDILHRPGLAGTQTGYRKDKCRCLECRAWNRNQRRRERGTMPGYMTGMSVKPPPTRSVTAYDFASKSMSDILTGFSIDPDWCALVREGIVGEIAALQNLIDRHNQIGNSPQIGYGWQGGYFRVYADDPEPENPMNPPEPANTQLPQSAPLAMPRNVRQGRTPTVPGNNDSSSESTWG